mmetsp:Transcript_5931/g.12339  ORF Transcript_5931/g.12339 Transcript_5931/m.12339 type:complete len:254 (-) Transcript_5931:112-873(-)
MQEDNQREEELDVWKACSAEDEDTECDLTESYYSLSVDSTYLIKEISPVDSANNSQEFSVGEEDLYADHEEPLLGGFLPRVRFNSEPTVGESASTLDDKHLLWYNAEEYEGFKKENGASLRKLAMGKSGQSLCCLRALQKLTRRVQKLNSEERTPTTRLDQLSERKLDEMYSLLSAEEVVGLEPYVVRVRLNDGRKVRLPKLMDRIEMFTKMSTKGSDPFLFAEELRKSCITVSQASVVFANRIAQARARQLA